MGVNEPSNHNLSSTERAVLDAIKIAKIPIDDVALLSKYCAIPEVHVRVAVQLLRHKKLI